VKVIQHKLWNNNRSGESPSPTIKKYHYLCAISIIVFTPGSNVMRSHLYSHGRQLQAETWMTIDGMRDFIIYKYIGFIFYTCTTSFRLRRDHELSTQKRITWHWLVGTRVLVIDIIHFLQLRYVSYNCIYLHYSSSRIGKSYFVWIWGVVHNFILPVQNWTKISTQYCII